MSFITKSIFYSSRVFEYFSLLICSYSARALGGFGFTICFSFTSVIFNYIPHIVLIFRASTYVVERLENVFFKNRKKIKYTNDLMLRKINVILVSRDLDIFNMKRRILLYFVFVLSFYSFYIFIFERFLVETHVNGAIRIDIYKVFQFGV